MSQFDREVDFLEAQLERGEISLQEFNREMRELQRDYIAAAEEAAQEAAQEAYDREMDRW